MADPAGVIRKNGQFAKGTIRYPNAGTKKGAKLRRLDDIIATMEVQLGRNCDPVVTMLELAAGHDALAQRELEYCDQDAVEKILTTPGWRNVTESDCEKFGFDKYVLWLLKDNCVPRDIRLDAAKAVAKFVRPMLAQTEIANKEGETLSVVVANFPASQLMGDEESVKFLETMQIALAQKVRQQRLDEEKETED